MICVSIQETTLQGCLKAMADAPMVELRADLCRLSLEELEVAVASHPNLLITCRIANSSIEFAREQIITAIRKGAKYVDIEIEAPVDFLEYVKVYAQVNGAKLIISYHDFNGTPSFDELRQIADVCRRKGADIVKIVTTAHDISDAVRTLRLYKIEGWAKEFTTNNYSEVKDVKLLAFAMGKAGQLSRYLSLKLGAPYTYCAFGEDSATAPGQYTVAQMEKLLEQGCQELNYNLNITSTSIPCSKSVAQRAILAAAFAKGVTLLTNFEPCNDINGAIKVIEQFGCSVECENGELVIKSGGAAEIVKGLLASGEDIKIVTGESGLLTRLLIPFAAYASGCGEVPGGEAIGGVLGRECCIEIAGHGSILGRNLGGAAAAVERAGAVCSTTNGGYLPFTVSGGMTARRIVIDGAESSQTVSGFLMTLPLLPYNTVLQIENPTSIPYINLTLGVLENFGIEINEERLSDGSIVFYIEGGQEYTPCSLYMEPDWSSASFFAVAYAISSMMEHRGVSEGRKYALLNMQLGTAQADEAILKILEMAGAKVEAIPSGYAYDIYISAPEGLSAFDFDATNAPDLFPILAVLALFCNGKSVIKGVGRLLQKESNRAESIYTEFTALGADINIEGDYMYICGTDGEDGSSSLHGGNVHSHNDHRIAMSLIVASLFVGEPVFLDELKCMDKSFPSFLRHLSDN